MDEKFYLTVGTEMYFPLNPILEATGEQTNPYFQSICRLPTNSSAKLVEEVLQSAPEVGPDKIFCEAELVVVVGTYMSSFICLLVIPTMNPFEWVRLVKRSHRTFYSRCHKRINSSKMQLQQVAEDLHLTTGNAAYLIKDQNARLEFRRVANIFNNKGANTLNQIVQPKSIVKREASKFSTSIQWKGCINQEGSTKRSLFGDDKFLNVLEGKWSRKGSLQFKNLLTNIEEENCSLIEGAFEKSVSPEKLILEWKKLKTELNDIPPADRLLTMGYIAGMLFCDPSFRMSQIEAVERKNWAYVKTPTLDLDEVSKNIFPLYNIQIIVLSSLVQLSATFTISYKGAKAADEDMLQIYLHSMLYYVFFAKGTEGLHPLGGDCIATVDSIMVNCGSLSLLCEMMTNKTVHFSSSGLVSF
jgi:hypothetical protein